MIGGNGAKIEASGVLMGDFEAKTRGSESKLGHLSPNSLP